MMTILIDIIGIRAYVKKNIVGFSALESFTQKQTIKTKTEDEEKELMDLINKLEAKK